MSAEPGSGGGLVTAVIYNTSTGAITATYQASAAQVGALSAPYVIVTDYAPDYDSTHMVVNGAVTPMTAAQLAPAQTAAAWATLRVKVDRLMDQYVNSVSVVQWAAMTGAQQSALGAYAAALGQVVANTTDPSNPAAFPTPPS